MVENLLVHCGAVLELHVDVADELDLALVPAECERLRDGGGDALPALHDHEQTLGGGLVADVLALAQHLVPGVVDVVLKLLFSRQRLPDHGHEPLAQGQILPERGHQHGCNVLETNGRVLAVPSNREVVGV